jgi:ABC-type branched-subunit amino acid transport system ATPase component/ABC-type branched-subunit amino acid transport system permease subunit
MRWGAAAVGIAVLLAVPLFLSESRTNLAAAIVVFAIVGMSLVLLTGWAGQVSLGQMAFVGIGAAVAGAATARLEWDLVPAVVLAGLVGAGVALVIGLPALRRRGLTLAVTSLAFALATSSWLLNRSFFGPGHLLDWLPADRIARPDLFGLSLSSETRMYYVCLGGLALAFAAVLGLRRTRTGRALVAVRDNERASQAFGVHAHRITLFAFAASGFLAAFAGALFVHQQSGLTTGPYRPEESLSVFTMAVIGGLGSIPGAILGAAYVRSVDYYFAQEWQILATGVGLLVVLWLFPGGLGGAFADLRDAFLRRVARRHGLATPSLVPDLPVAMDTASVVPPVATASSGDALLQVRDLAVAYDGVRVLHGIDLEVREGEVVALLGTNGAGKSTVLRAIAGTAPVSVGAIVFAGNDISRIPADVRARRGIVSAPGDAGTFPGLTVREHLRLAAWASSSTIAPRDAVATALERIPELAERLDDRAGDLSGGQQQMVNVAMALLASPRVLLLDELSLGLAPAVVTRLFGIVRDLAAAGTTIVLVEQSVPLALEVAERAYFLEKGTVRFVGPTRELLDRPDLVRAVLLERASPAPTAPTDSGPVAGDSVRANVASSRNGGAVRLEVRSVSKRFGGVVALDDVSFDVHDGEILGILGPNGAGKTTLFDVLSGFVAADAGHVVLHDDGTTIELDGHSPASRAQAGLGRSFQDARLFPALTSAEAVAVASEDQIAVRDPVAAALHLPAVRSSEHAVDARVDELLDRFGISVRRAAFVRELSTGTRRVLDLACVTAAEPRVLLLDEPSAGIARAETDALAPLLRGLRDTQGVTLVVIEHDLALLQAVCGRVIALDVGAVIAAGPPDDVVRDPAVVAAYVGRTP